MNLILTSILPFTGASDNSSGTAAQHGTRDTWNDNIKQWAANRTNVLYFDINGAIGMERKFAKSGDGAPTAGNLWDLRPEFIYTTDALGIHLSAEGGAAAGGALAGQIRAYEYTKELRNNLRAKRHRLRFDALAPIRQWFFEDN